MKIGVTVAVLQRWRFKIQVGQVSLHETDVH